MSEITHLSQVKTDAALTNLVVGYGANDVIYNKIFPKVPVAKDTDFFYKWEDNGTKVTKLETRRADRAKAAEVGIAVGQDTYAVEQHALRDFLEDGVIKNADSILNLRENCALNITDLLELKREIACMNIVFSTSNYDTGNYTTLSGNDRWSIIAHADSDPQSDIIDALEIVKKKARVKPNTFVCGEHGFNLLRKHAKVKEAIKYVQATGNAQMTLQAIADFLGVERILVGDATYDTAAEGQTSNNDFVWSQDAALIYVPTRPGIKTPGYGYTFEPTHTPRTVERYREQGIKGEWVEVNEKYVFKVAFNKAGYLFKNAFNES